MFRGEKQGILKDVSLSTLTVSITANYALPPLILQHLQDTLTPGELIIHRLYAGSGLATEEKVNFSGASAIWLGDKITLR